MGLSDFCHNCFSDISEEKCEKCGYINKDNVTASAIPPGTLLNKKYKVGRVLGVGGFGITYKALDVDTNRIVAVKEYFPWEMAFREMDNISVCVKTAKKKPFFDEGLITFIEEANFLVLLRKYNSIVEIYDCFNENNTAYFAMEFIDGYTFKEITNANYDLAYESMLKVANALRLVHREGIVHRDISPQNIFLMKNSDIKLIDFGNARYYNRKNDNDEKLVLKPGFSPPELYMKENVQGPWTDIYSLAATFYTIVTNTKLPSALERINGIPIVPIKRFVPDIKYGLEIAINRALELDYEKRQKSIDEFLDEINSSFYNNTVPTEYYNKSVVTQQIVKDSAVPANFRSGPQNGKETIKKKISNNLRSINSNMSYVLSYDGRLYPISDIKDIVIGRNAATSHIVINDSNVSRKHCVIEYNSFKREFYITDWSVNGTFTGADMKLEYGVKYKLAVNQNFYVYSPKYMFKVVIRNGNDN